MKKITLISISILIFVLCISCASAADLNSNSIADDNAIIAETCNVNLDTPVASLESDKRELARPEVTEREEIGSVLSRPGNDRRKQLGSEGPNIFQREEGPNIFQREEGPNIFQREEGPNIFQKMFKIN